MRPRADRILFAATKADHLHPSSHDRLEAILRRMVDRAIARAGVAGAGVDVIALASVRATREAQVRRDGETLPSIIGVPAAGETVGGRRFDGQTEVAVFPGDLPANPDALFSPGKAGFRGLSSSSARERAISASCGSARRRSNAGVTARRRYPIFVLIVRFNS